MNENKNDKHDLHLAVIVLIAAILNLIGEVIGLIKQFFD